MATYHAIAATSDAIRRLLENSRPTGEFPDAEFKIFQASDFQAGLTEGVSVYLYRVAVNTTNRNLQARVGPDGRRYAAPVPLDLFYLVSAWAANAYQQQLLLGWAVRTLANTTSIPTGFLNQGVPTEETFQPNEVVELVLDVVAPPDLHNLWDVFRVNQQRSEQLSVAYVARMVGIESQVKAFEQGYAQTRELEFRKPVQP